MIYYKVHQKNGVFLGSVYTESNTVPKFCVRDAPPTTATGQIAKRENGKWVIVNIADLNKKDKEIATAYLYDSYTGYYLRKTEITKTAGYDVFLIPARSTLTTPPHNKAAFDFELKKWATAQEQAVKSTTFYNKRTKEKEIFYKDQYNKKEYTAKAPASAHAVWNWDSENWEIEGAVTDAEALQAHAWVISELQKTDIMLKYIDEKSALPGQELRCKYDKKTILKYRKELRDYTTATIDNGIVSYKIRHNNKPKLPIKES